MTTEIRNIRLRAFTSATLDRNANQKHEIYLDGDNYTLRIADGSTLGGFSLLRNDLANLKSTALNTSINVGTGTITASGFRGPLTGNVTGNVTGNASTVTNGLYSTGTYANPSWLTSIASSKITGNVASADTLSTSRNINGVAFNGSANITISTIVNGSNTVTLEATGKLTLPANSDISVSSGLLTLNNSLLVGAGGSLLNKDNATWALYGQTSDPGTIITLPGQDDASNGMPLSLRNDFSGGIEIQGTTTISGPLTTTNDVTVGANVNISTKPTLKTHATNRGYVDKKAVAMAVALG